MDDRIRDLIFQAIDQTISKQDFEELQDAIENDPVVRDQYLSRSANRSVNLQDPRSSMRRWLSENPRLPMHRCGVA